MNYMSNCEGARNILGLGGEKFEVVEVPLDSKQVVALLDLLRAGVGEVIEENDVVELSATEDFLDTFYVRDGVASGLTRLYFSKWSSKFVHGADSLIPITSLASKLLIDNESIISMSEVKWIRPMRKNLKLVAFDAKNAPVVDDGVLVRTVFKISGGREIVVLGYESGGDIDFKMNGTVPADTMICICPKCKSNKLEIVDDVFNVPFVLPVKAMDLLAQNRGLLLATLADALNLALTRASGQLFKGINPVLKLVSGIEGLVIPTDLALLCREEQDLEIKLISKRTTRTGFNLVELAYRFPFQRDFSSMTVAYTENVELASGY